MLESDRFSGWSGQICFPNRGSFAAGHHRRLDATSGIDACYLMAHRMGRLSRILSHWTAVSATALFVCVGVSGHELGTVGVDASFSGDGTYSIQILVDVEHLQIGLGPDTSLNSVIPGV